MKNKYKIKALALIDIKCKSFFMLSTNNRYVKNRIIYEENVYVI